MKLHMMQLAKYLAATGAVVVGSLFASPSGAAPVPVNDFKTIYVGSMIGDQAEMDSLGITVFNNKSSSIVVTDTPPSKLVVLAAREYLSGKHQTVEFKPPAIWAKKLKISGFNTVPGSLSADIVELPDPKPDAYLVFASDPRYVDNAHQTLGDLGVYSSPNGYKLYLAYVNFTVFLIDAKSGRIVKYEEGRISKPGGLQLDDRLLGMKVAVRWPETPILSSNWPKTLDGLNDDQRLELGNDVRKLIAESVPFTLHLMGFDGSVEKAPSLPMKP